MNFLSLVGCCFVVYQTVLQNSANAYNILVTTVSLSASQNLMMYRLAELLGERGHNVTILKRDMYPHAKTIIPKYSREIVHSMNRTKVKSDEVERLSHRFVWMQHGLQSLILQFRSIDVMLNSLWEDCEYLITDELVLNQLKTQKYDVIIMHFLDMCSYGLAHALGIKSTIWMSIAHMPDIFSWFSNSPTTPSYVVEEFGWFFDEMNFVERIQNSALTLFAAIYYRYFVVKPYTETFRRIYGRQFPPMDQLVSNTQLYFINSDPAFDLPRPVPHNVIYVGGLSIANAAPSKSKFQKMINDSGDEGFIYFSLGTIVNGSTMPLEIKRAFIAAFRRIPQKVFWAVEGDKTEANSVPNIYARDWLPQRELIGNPKIKLFITHGGFNSFAEAAYFGVPMVMMPLFAEQHANCKRMERLKIGIELKRENFSEITVLQTLNSVINDREIQSNAKRLGRMIRNKPESSNDLALKWVEYLAEFQTLDHLKPASRKLNLFQYFLFDIILSLLIIIFLFLYIVFVCLKHFCTTSWKIKEKFQ